MKNKPSMLLVAFLAASGVVVGAQNGSQAADAKAAKPAEKVAAAPQGRARMAAAQKPANAKVAQSNGTHKVAAAKAAAPAPAGKYGGVENCKMCHSEIHDDWAKTAHAKGFDLLVNVGKEKSAECLPCHTTGYGKGGFVDEESTPGLKGITCEACHGPGEEHMGDKTKIQRVPSGKTCAACHQNTNLHALPAE